MNNKSYPLLKAFERHYRKTSKVFRELNIKGSFTYQAKGDANGFSSETKVPDEDLVIKFAILMRRFLNDTYPLFYKNIWKQVQKDFGEESPSKIIEQINSDIHLFETKGNGISIQINGSDVNVRKAYKIIAEGEYFYHDEKARAFLLSLANVPLVGPLF